MRKTVAIPALLLFAVAAIAGIAFAGGDDNVMEKKSSHAERILRFLAIGDLQQVGKEAAELERLTIDAKFEDRDKENAQYGREFLKIVRALKAEAGRGNFAATYYQFSRMTGVCFACHEHVRGK
jgi:hypothetical protein